MSEITVPKSPLTQQQHIDAYFMEQRNRVLEIAAFLDRLDAATDLGDLRVPPSHRLEKLSGDRAGQYSIRINEQWRVCFNWRSCDAYDVEIVDYH